MKKVFKVIGLLVLLVAILAAAGITYLKTSFPKVDPPKSMVIDTTFEMVERGKYLANHVAVCIDCHSARDWSKFAGPIIPGTEGKGGEVFNEDFGFPGTFYARNITPYNLGKWTDGEIYRLITTGVNKHNHAIFPVMPYLSYASMDSNDVKSIIAYLRTLRPIQNDVPESHANFPMNLILPTIPKNALPVKNPDEADSLEYGRYLTKIAACADCHTPAVKGEPIKELYMAGGFEFPLPTGGIVRSANITPHKINGIGSWTEEMFILRFKTYDNHDGQTIPAKKGGFNTVMPWTMFAGMKEADLKCIFKYLQSLPVNDHQVIKFTPSN